MINPLNEEYRTDILNVLKEVVTKYPDLDGLMLDRVRYDGITADFSSLSRKKFEEYIGKKVANFPEDIFRWTKNADGKYIPESTSVIVLCALLSWWISGWCRNAIFWICENKDR